MAPTVLNLVAWNMRIIGIEKERNDIHTRYFGGLSVQVELRRGSPAIGSSLGQRQSGLRLLGSVNGSR